MNRLLLFLFCTLCACHTHRARHASQQDSSHVHTATAVAHTEKATAQSIRQHQLRWSAGSTAVVILPKGLVSYHPIRGFEGEATAILTARTQREHIESQRHQATDQTERRSSAIDFTSATQTHAQEQESRTDSQPVKGYPFTWLAIALIAGSFLLVVYRFWPRQ